MFFFRLWTAPNWTDLFSIVSMITSALCVPTTQGFEERSELAPEPRWVPGAIRLNLILSVTIAVATLLKHYIPPEGVEVTFHMDAYENMGLIPLGKFFLFLWGLGWGHCCCWLLLGWLVLWVFTQVTRKALRAVDTGSLEELRYRYLGAWFWGWPCGFCFCFSVCARAFFFWQFGYRLWFRRGCTSVLCSPTPIIGVISLYSLVFGGFWNSMFTYPFPEISHASF